MKARIRGWTEAAFGRPATRRLVRDNLRGIADFRAAGRMFNTNPVALFAYLYPASAVLLGLFKPEYVDPERPAFVIQLITTGKVLLYWLVCALTLGDFARPVLRAGLPFVVVPLGMWLIAVVVSNGSWLLFEPDFEFRWERVARQAAITIPGSLAITWAVAPQLRARLGMIPELVPIWLPIREVPIPLVLELPPDRRGRLRRIHAANQYIEVVTEQGSTLLRMPLHQALAMVPEDMGWHCHRSLWIARDEVQALAYVGGQPQVTDAGGEVHPVSRKMAPLIRDALDARAG